MTNDYFYALEKLDVAVRELTIGTDRIQPRLFSAYLSFHTLRAADLPEELQVDFQLVHDELTSQKALGDEGRVQATLAKMNDEQASQIAGRIVDLASRLRDMLPKRS